MYAVLAAVENRNLIRSNSLKLKSCEILIGELPENLNAEVITEELKLYCLRPMNYGAMSDLRITLNGYGL